MVSRLPSCAGAAGREAGRPVHAVRAWCERLPFRDGSFASSFAKGSLDHFDDPASGIAELARVTAPAGRVVLSVANMDSLGCRGMARADRGARAVRRTRPGRRHCDAPADHYTRYDPDLLLRQASAALDIEIWHGVSLLWGVPWWTTLLDRLPGPLSRALLRTAEAIELREISHGEDVAVDQQER